MRRGGCCIRVAAATKHAEVGVVRWRAVEKLIRCLVLVRTAMAAIEQIGSCGECVGLELWGNGGMEKKGA